MIASYGDDTSTPNVDLTSIDWRVILGVLAVGALAVVGLVTTTRTVTRVSREKYRVTKTRYRARQRKSIESQIQRLQKQLKRAA